MEHTEGKVDTSGQMRFLGGEAVRVTPGEGPVEQLRPRAGKVSASGWHQIGIWAPGACWGSSVLLRFPCQ